MIRRFLMLKWSKIFDKIFAKNNVNLQYELFIETKIPEVINPVYNLFKQC